MSVASRRLAPAPAWEPAVAVGAGVVFLLVSLLLFLGKLAGLGSAASLFAAVLAASSLVLLLGGAYVWSALRSRRPMTRARPSPSVRPPASPTGRAAPPDDDLDAPSGFLVPIDLDDEAPYLPADPGPFRSSAARARGSGAAAAAVRRSASADDVYRSAVSPMSGSIAFAPVIQSTARPPSPPVEAAVITTGPSPRPSASLLGGSRRTDPLLDEPPLTVPARPPRPPISPARSGATATIAQIPQPPNRPSVAATTSRHCTSCDASLPGDLNVPLCWGCGRVLCTSCYWRNGPGPGLHRCPECTARASSQPAPPVGATTSRGGPRSGAGLPGATVGPPKGGR